MSGFSAARTIQRHGRGRLAWGAALALVVVRLTLAPEPAAAGSVTSCKLHIVQLGQKYVRDTLSLLQKCERGIREGLLPPQDCRLEPKTMATITKLVSKLRERIRKKCAGITPDRIGFPSPECPAVATLDEMTDCLAGFINARVDEMIAAELGCPGRCGDGTADVACGEQCDGTDFGGQSCTSLGFANGGTLLCTPECTFYTGGCVP
jgi:hypothetical protein